MLAAALIIIVYFFILRTLPIAVASLLIVVFIWVIIAVLVAPPLARLFSEKAIATLFGEKVARISRDYSRARSLAAQGKFEEAIEEYRREVEKDPENVMLRLEIAEIYSSEMKEYSRAVSELEECLKVNLGPTQGASVLNRMADIYDTNLGEPEAALAALRTIQEKWPGTKLAARAQERIRIIEEAMQDSR